ncbi:sugar transferase [Labrys portucalensis]|uniref:Sugar transferase n=1 Tax=Labrys neptuniae TaxID=376174 RepID=A0ABV6ZQD2_9HYPH
MMDSASQNRVDSNSKSGVDRSRPRAPVRGTFVADRTKAYYPGFWAVPKSGSQVCDSESGTLSPYLLSYRKRVLDICVAATALVILSPLFLTVGLIIRLGSPGPALFRQTRTGTGGRPFTVYKFRSMQVQPPSRTIVAQARRGDERITSFGRFIRRTSIDELPQMLNVLNGTMSLVGPRPHAVEHDAYYTTRIANYPLRFAALPGLSGLAQVSGARGSTPRLEDMERRLAYDLNYIQSASLRSDLRILAATIREMLLSTSAY